MASSAFPPDAGARSLPSSLSLPLPAASLYPTLATLAKRGDTKGAAAGRLPRALLDGPDVPALEPAPDAPAPDAPVLRHAAKAEDSTGSLLATKLVTAVLK